VRYDGEERVLSLTAGAEEDRELRQAIGLVDVVLSLDSGEISYEIWRNDIQQNMFRRPDTLRGISLRGPPPTRGSVHSFPL
jgi:hypothetical protein